MANNKTQVSVAVAPSRKQELACVQACGDSNRTTSECRVACRCFGNSELVILHREREAAGPKQREWWARELAHVRRLAEETAVEEKEDAARRGGARRRESHLLLTAQGAYEHRLGAHSCELFERAVQAVTEEAIGTLGHYEAVMHYAACLFTLNRFAPAIQLFWHHFAHLPSLATAVAGEQSTSLWLKGLQYPASEVEGGGQGVITILTSASPGDLSDLEHCLHLLDANLAPSLPILIFHDGLSPAQETQVRGFSDKHAVVIEELQLRDLEYERVFEARGGVWYKDVRQGKMGRGYLHMIRLYAGMLWHHPALHYFRAYMRLDTDSFFIAPSKHPVEQLKEGTVWLREQSGHQDALVSYAHWIVMQDQESVTEGLWSVTAEFMRGRGVEPGSLHRHVIGRRAKSTQSADNVEWGPWNRDTFYNNLEVVRLSWIRGGLCSDYFRFLDWNLEWFNRRWSDAVIRSLQVFLSLQELETVSLQVGYKHQTSLTCPPSSYVFLLHDFPQPSHDLCDEYGARLELMHRRLRADRALGGGDERVPIFLQTAAPQAAA